MLDVLRKRKPPALVEFPFPRGPAGGPERVSARSAEEEP